jgi:hypothetical protein
MQRKLLIAALAIVATMGLGLSAQALGPAEKDLSPAPLDVSRGPAGHKRPPRMAPKQESISLEGKLTFVQGKPAVDTGKEVVLIDFPNFYYYAYTDSFKGGAAVKVEGYLLTPPAPPANGKPGDSAPNGDKGLSPAAPQPAPQDKPASANAQAPAQNQTKVILTKKLTVAGKLYDLSEEIGYMRGFMDGRMEDSPDGGGKASRADCDCRGR